MFEITATVKNEAILRRLIDRVRKQPKRIEAIMARVKEKYEPRIKVALAQEPGPSDGHPLWTSDAQRVKVLSILRQQAKAAGRADIRYVRTHRLSSGYLVEVVPGEQPNQFGIQVSNAMPYHVFVKYKWQQRFHATTGWARDDAYLTAIQEEMAEEFADQATFEFKEGE